MYLVFRAPDGTQTKGDDALNQAVQHIDKGDAAYWASGSGDAALLAGNVYDPTQFELYFDGVDRFQVRFYKPGACTQIALAPDEGSETAVILVGGNPMELEGKTLVDRATAVCAAEHFAAFSRPDPLLEWC